MAAGNFTLVDQGLLELNDGTQDWATDNHYLVLITDSHTPDASTEATLADISANEVADADYSPQDMTGESVTKSGGVVTFDADNVTFGSSVTITAKYAYVVVGTVAGKTGTDALVGYVDLDSGGGSVSSTSGSFAVNWNASGMWTEEQTS